MRQVHLCCVLIVVNLIGVFSGSTSTSLIAKVGAGGFHEAILELPSIMDKFVSSPKLASLSGDAKVTALVTMLKNLSSASQAHYVNIIKSIKGVEVEQFWAANIIQLKGVDKVALDILSNAEGEFKLREPYSVSVDPIAQPKHINISQTVQWGVQRIGAPTAWTKTEGEGIVVGIIDTGANAAHITLRDNFAGPWLDPIYNEGISDHHGHGTYNLGVIVGQLHGIGVAPAARWIACRGLNNQGAGTEGYITSCAQFMLTASPRPHIVSNSWGGGQAQTWFNSQISAWKEAGIIPVFAVGSNGAPACRTVNSPADQPNVISVGATIDNLDAMAPFSSRGRALSGVMKPDFTAPGKDILTAGLGLDAYVTVSGTAFAASHVAGAVALALSANQGTPGYGLPEVVKDLENHAAHPFLMESDKLCGLEGPTDFPNNAYGYGRIDVSFLGN